MKSKSQDMKYVHLCYKCSIGRHSQHSHFTGKGLFHGLWKEALKNDPNQCQCLQCRGKPF